MCDKYRCILCTYDSVSLLFLMALRLFDSGLVARYDAIRNGKTVIYKLAGIK